MIRVVSLPFGYAARGHHIDALEEMVGPERYIVASNVREAMASLARRSPEVFVCPIQNMKDLAGQANPLQRASSVIVIGDQSSFSTVSERYGSCLNIVGRIDTISELDPQEFRRAIQKQLESAGKSLQRTTASDEIRAIGTPLPEPS